MIDGAKPARRAAARPHDGMATLAEVIQGGFMRTASRHPIIRSGERDDIPAHLRAAIWYRDNGLCAICPGREYQPEGPMHLDHVIPWSAGGTDASDNLRLLCEAHNQERSNFVDFTGPQRVVTWWCHRCYSADGPSWAYYEGGWVICPTHQGRTRADGKARCRVERVYNQRREQDLEPDWWHMRDGLVLLGMRAFCVHCMQPGYTSLTL